MNEELLINRRTNVVTHFLKIVSSQKQSRHLMDVGVVVVVLVVYNMRIYFLRLLY